MTPEIILAVLTGLTPYYEDAKQTKEERVEYFTPIAHGLHDASQRATCTGAYAVEGCKKLWTRSPRKLVSLAIMTGWWESRFASRIFAGKCRPGECDSVELPNGSFFYKAQGAWQQQATGFLTYAEWKELPGNAKAQTWQATAAISRAHNHCKTVEGAVALYATGRWCGWKGAKNRVLFAKRIEDKLKVQPKTKKAAPDNS